MTLETDHSRSATGDSLPDDSRAEIEALHRAVTAPDLDDRTIYRTELNRHGAVGGGDRATLHRAGTWTLHVDSRLVATTEQQPGGGLLTPADALAWARAKLGEGVVFLAGDAAGNYYVASPETNSRPGTRR